MTVRRAGPDDAAVVADLVSRFFAEEGFATTPAQVAERAETFLGDDSNAAFLFEREGAAVGVATVTTVFGFETGRYAEIEDLYVLPVYRGRGVGRDLVEAAVAWSAERGCADVEVVVTPAGEGRHGLGGWYRLLGFADSGRRIMQRELG
jgi:GNAT superfamily N-acetyltransferase